MFKKILWKIIAPGLTILLIFIIIIFLWLMPKMENAVVDEKKKEIKSVVQTGYSVLDFFHKQEKQGILSTKEAQEAAKSVIKNFRYGSENKDYLWINDYQPVMLMHPYDDSLVNRDVGDLTDTKGEHFMLEFVKICKNEGEGYYEYSWKRIDSGDEHIPKIAFVKNFDPWDWIVGSGVYVDKIRDQMISRFFVTAIIIVLVTVGLGIFILFLARTITKPIHSGIQFAKSVSEGDLSKTVEITTNDEIAELLGSLNSMVKQLSGVVTSINDVSTHLAASSEEISASALSLSDGSQTQAANVEETSASIEELSATIKQINSNVEEVNNLSNKSMKMASDSRIKVDNAIESMRKISTSSQKIQEIIGVINDIADQTNLLSLNASIEAARAGEHGRGFAVVADEISKLSDRSASSTKEIEELIVQTIKDITEGVTLVNEASDAFKNIVSAVNQMDELITEITQSIQQQDDGTTQVAGAIEQINDIAQSTSASAEELSSNTVELEDQAEKLKSLIKHFKIISNDDDKKRDIDVANYKNQ